MKKYFALLLTVVLILPVLAACADKKIEPTSNTSAQTQAQTTTAGEETSQTEASTANTTIPVSQSDIPDEVPADLTDVAALNSFATNLYLKYVKPNIFTAPASLFSEAEKNDARKALALIIDAETKAIDIYDKNESFYFLRGKAYEQSYYDTKDASLKEKGLEDLQKALDMGLSMAQANYDALNAAQ